MNGISWITQESYPQYFRSQQLIFFSHLFELGQVAEVNNGGDLVEGMLRSISKYIPYSSVRAIRGKISRAEPVALLYESSNAFHTKKFEFLERQMLCMSHENDEESEGGQHDDRVDALVWAVTELTSRKTTTPRVVWL